MRGEAVVGPTEMAAVYQASRDDVQACIGRSLESWARATTIGVKKNAERKKIWREGEGFSGGG